MKIISRVPLCLNSWGKAGVDKHDTCFGAMGLPLFTTLLDCKLISYSFRIVFSKYLHNGELVPVTCMMKGLALF